MIYTAERYDDIARELERQLRATFPQTTVERYAQAAVNRGLEGVAFYDQWYIAIPTEKAPFTKQLSAGELTHYGSIDKTVEEIIEHVNEELQALERRQRLE